jgi:hypothetical protein
MVDLDLDLDLDLELECWVLIWIWILRWKLCLDLESTLNSIWTGTRITM